MGASQYRSWNIKGKAHQILLSLAFGAIVLGLINFLVLGACTSSAPAKNKKLPPNGGRSHDGGWCPRSSDEVCDDALDNHWGGEGGRRPRGVCDVCNRRFLIILAHGRSASTSLTWMLDALPGIRMSGENNDLLTRLNTLRNDTMDYVRIRESIGKHSAWGRNPIPNGSFSCVAQHMVEAMTPSPPSGYGNDDRATIIGFKTIRFHKWTKMKKEQIEAKVNFLVEMFPCAKFLVNFRSNMTAHTLSATKAFGGTKASGGSGDFDRIHKKYLILNQNLHNIAKNLAKQHGDSTYLLDSEEWTRDISVLNNLVEWLGFNGKRCHFSGVAEYNTAGRTGYTHGLTNISAGPWCQILDHKSNQHQFNNLSAMAFHNNERILEKIERAGYLGLVNETGRGVSRGREEKG
ncbi:hypothetical protein ACHAWF_001137 [Thalassiosira exigua]